MILAIDRCTALIQNLHMLCLVYYHKSNYQKENHEVVLVAILRITIFLEIELTSLLA